MMKEIYEQPEAVEKTFNNFLENCIGIDDEKIIKFSSINVVACGSAWHVGMACQYVIENLAKVQVRVELASEFRYRKPLLDQNQLVVAISQSGETADTLAALRFAKEHGVKTLAIVNVVGSSIARDADNVWLVRRFL